jgi:hypothetical protein
MRWPTGSSWRQRNGLPNAISKRTMVARSGHDLPANTFAKVEWWIPAASATSLKLRLPI